jgi:pimeloyl-ACP methyl ester carboxylesterase
MPHLTTDDGVKLYYEDTGTGTPIVFVHEFAGDHRSWEPQVRYFSRNYRCITYSARGYVPSDVPKSFESYSQERWRDDILSVIDALKLPSPHVVGLSMGGFATLHFGMEYCKKGRPVRAQSLTIAGCGSGAHPAVYKQFQADAVALAERIRSEGMGQMAATYGHGPTRIQFQNKDPRGFAEFARQLAEHSAEGSANCSLGYQGRRPCIYDMTEQMAAIDVPALIMTGDEDEACLEPSILMKRAIPKSGLAILPKSGHGINLEEPALFNRLMGDFLHQVESGRWGARDPRAALQSVFGPEGKPKMAGRA